MRYKVQPKWSFIHIIWHNNNETEAKGGTSLGTEQSNWAKKGSDFPHTLSGHIASIFKRLSKSFFSKFGYYKQFEFKEEYFLNTMLYFHSFWNISPWKGGLFLKLNNFRVLYIHVYGWFVSSFVETSSVVLKKKMWKYYRGADERPHNFG